MRRRTVTLIGVVCVLTGWLAASVMSPRIASLQSVPDVADSKAIRSPARDGTTSYSDRLRGKLRERSPQQPSPRRNPFLFGAREGARTKGAARAASPSVDPATLASPPSGPQFDLAGIGTSAGPGGAIQTAVISATGTVLLVRAGDTLPGGYRVLRVHDDSVVLIGPANEELILRLR